MPATYRTSRPEINRLFPRGLPQIGVTLILGAPKSGKTLLAMDIVREVLKTSGDRVLVLCEEPERWRKAIGHANLTVRNSFNSDDKGAVLTVVDAGQISAPVIRLAQHSPLLVTAGGLTAQTALTLAAEVALRIDRLDDGFGKLTIVKSRHERTGVGTMEEASVQFKVDPVLGFVATDYQAPSVRSAWDRLLEEEDLV